MPELFIELFSEEIPARMQARGAADLERLVGEALAAIRPNLVETFYGPRRIALYAEVDETVEATRSTERGPREGAPEQALAGFLRKHGAAREALRAEGGFWVLDKAAEAAPAERLVAAAMPGLLRRFPWPKSMRWGGTSAFTWVRPLRRIVCLLDGRVVPFDLRDGDDDGHGLASSNLTEGHRFHAPGAFAVEGAADWEARLRERRVLVRADQRRSAIAGGVARLAAEKGLTVADDPGLLDEVAGLVEWPVPLLGRIGEAFMDLPPEVMQVSMRVNQRYFALRHADGSAAPWFAFAANIEADDGGAAVVAGNERVLRARFSDARHFWDLDRRTRLEDRVAALDKITFHTRLGSQGDRVRRIEAAARLIAPRVGADADKAARAARLAKADLTTGMVGEFPELQGVIGSYYALHDMEDPELVQAIRDQYAPKSSSDAAPSAPVSVALALADRLDQIISLFRVGEKPTGSGDPYALRRAALGAIRMLVDPPGDRIVLRRLFAELGAGPNLINEVFTFFADRLRAKLRAEGKRHDVVTAAMAIQQDDQISDVIRRADALEGFLATADGANLLAGYRRAANILRIEEAIDGPFAVAPLRPLMTEEATLRNALDRVHGALISAVLKKDYERAMAALAELRQPLDAFFERVTVNDSNPDLRRARLGMLTDVRATMHIIVDFSLIEG